MSRARPFDPGGQQEVPMQTIVDDRRLPVDIDALAGGTGGRRAQADTTALPGRD